MVREAGLVGKAGTTRDVREVGRRDAVRRVWVLIRPRRRLEDDEALAFDGVRFSWR